MRDERVLGLFAAGWSLRRIAEAVGLRSPSSVSAIIRRQSERTGRMREHADAIFVERSEALFRANWPAALAGNWQATQIVDRVLHRQAVYYGLYD